MRSPQSRPVGGDIRQRAAARLGAVFVGLGVVGKEDGLDRLLEQPRDAERERQAGVVLAVLDRVDGLTGDLQLFGEPRLRPVALGAQRRGAGFSRVAPPRDDDPDHVGEQHHQQHVVDVH